jgi:DNA topoisomerase-3
MSPGLFDLTSLQREANSRFGFSAKNTLGLAQALYEKHKVLTYPRTDSRHLPEDYLDTVKETWRRWRRTTTITSSPSRSWTRLGQAEQAHLRQHQDRTTSPSSRPPGAQEPVRAGTEAVRPGDAPLHGRVLPAGRVPGHHPHTEVSGHQFKTEGKVMINPGWLAIYGKEVEEDDKDKEGGQPGAVAPGEKVKTDKVDANGLVTKPPRATPKPRCCRPWKARASWWRRRTARGHGRQGPGHASHARPSSKAC